MSFIHVRHATPTDAPLLNSLRILSELEHDVNVPPEAIAQLNFTNPNKPLPHYREFIENTTLVATAPCIAGMQHPLITNNNQQVVGSTSFGLKKDNPNIMSVASLHARYIKGAKIGAHLMQQLVFCAKDMDLDSIELEPSDFALQWYKDFNFKYIDIEKQCILSASQFDKTLSDISARIHQIETSAFQNSLVIT